MNIFRSLLSSAALTTLLAPTPVHARVWISEFAASNQTGLVDRDGDAEDWLELFNDGPEEVSLAGWSLTDDVSAPRKWILPDVRLASGAYLVIFASGENRRLPNEELHTNFSMSKAGEYLGLFRPDGVTVEHEYAPLYPGQFEDVSFGLSQTGESNTVLLPQGAAGWAGVPSSAADFAAEFAGWNSEVDGSFIGSTWREVSTGVGLDQDAVYGNWIGAGGDFESDLFNQSGSLFVRLRFQVSDPDAVTRLGLRMRWNDGFIAYLNGTQVAANRAPVEPDWNSLATSERGVGENDDWISFPIDLSQVTLRAGANLLAVHGMSHAVDRPALLVFPELDLTTGGIDPSKAVYHTVPTPGAANGSGAAILAPLLTEVTSSADPPTGRSDSPPIVVTATVRPSVHPIAEARLYHRYMFEDETQLVMLDDGSGPDELAGDGVYSVEIPTGLVRRGQMVRWRVEVEDTASQIRRAPLYDSPTDADRYYGTVAEDNALDGSLLPVLHTFVENQGAVDTRGGGRTSIYYLGRFYDNVQMDLHGQSTAGFPKKSYDIDFNRGNRFLWKEGEGKVKDINLLTNWADKSKVRNSMAYEFLKRCGTPYHFAFPVRVQRNGAFFSVADMVEDGDDRYLDRVGLDGNGALYKMYDRMENASAASKKTRKEEGVSDLATLISRLNPSQSIDVRRRVAYDLVNIPATVNYLASLTVVGITDAGHKNYYMYRDTEGTGEWQPLPWDVDLSAGRRWTSSENYFHDQLHWDFWSHGNINRLWELIYNAPDYREMFLRRIQTLRDALLLPPGTPEERDWFTQRVREWEDLLDPEGVRSDADLDYIKWGSWGNRFQVRPAAERILTEWLPNRRDWMYSPARNQGGVPIPTAPRTVPRVTIEEIEFNPESGHQGQEYFTVKNNQPSSVDLSGWTVSGAVEMTFPPGTVIPAGEGTSASRYVGLLHVTRQPELFRRRSVGPRSGQLRFIVGGYEGQLSARGETLELRDAGGALVTSKTYPGDPTLPQQFLRITELNYHPTSPVPAEEAALPGVTTEDFEWIEFLNTGGEALDLEGVRFTEGIDFTFGAVSLEAGERLILAKLPAAFALRNPGFAGLVVGPYTGLLDNDGEPLRLVDAGGENVLSFDFNDRWYPPTDGGGRTLVLRQESLAWNLFDEPESWGSSQEIGGSAGAAGSGYLVHFNAWQTARFTAAERVDPLVGTATANPDGDPYPNWEEYALGLDPHLADQALFETEIVSFEGNDYLGGTARRRSQASDLIWDLEVSENGASWAPVSPEVVDVVSHPDGTETWSVREPDLVGQAPTRLARLRVRFVPGGE